ncbi:MAG TPA: DUF883 C-terminal domain-containing protein [Terracidiphilus sp.]|jgi:ElaB/YqjD/DUF883 family membrane-anchored ribosome-binding protein
MAVEVIENIPSIEEMGREASRIKDMITEAVDDGVRSAMKTIKQSRRAAEDAVDDTRQAVKDNPLEAVGIAFAAGMLTGVLAAWIGMKRR